MKNMITDIVIVQHPVSVCVPLNYTVTLSVRAQGTGKLTYQWFTSEDKEILGGNRADLKFAAQKSKLYICRVNNQFCNCVFSEWVKVKVLEIANPGLPESWQGEPHIVVQPAPQTIRPGENLTLCCSAFGIPIPHYQWYRNGHLLLGKTTDTLQIEKAEADLKGTYLCSVSNVHEERWTDPAEVDIVHQSKQRTSPTPTASDKVALLIGNLNYSYHPDLMAPTMDVHELTNLLQQLGFRVVSLLDLTRKEMLAAIDKFLLLLDRGVYALFYYAGHGYERLGRNYMVAIDAPQPYSPGNCVCVQRIMRKMQEKQTALCVVLLDTCRTWYKQDYIASEIRPLVPMGNTVYGYATCEDAEAYEVQDAGRSTGIFTKYLNKHILQPEKVTHILEHVSEDLGRDPLITGKQVVEIKHTLKEPRSLTDPISTAGHTGELHLRNACWRQANELPCRKLVIFPCGAEVEVSFSALFSNVMVAFGVVKTTGPKAQDCTVTLMSTPVMEDMFSPCRSGEMDSLLLNNVVAEASDCSLRLCGLQKLQGSLLINVDLHYTHMDSNLRLQESQQIDIGKPLVASCDLYRGQQASMAPLQEADLQSPGIWNIKQPPHQNLGRQGRPFTRKADCAAKVPTARNNEPEENDETELHDFTL
ncbi:hypothetical protein UPYG_G00264910 [Umbra pygmaea]|uniref:Mucosa-associated lymphoid tissue lymphoma translocation protein 1 n=1 Tax=Umbra pygmaea TaxID=75934 RepID=A0ABD0X017_UMBPY